MKIPKKDMTQEILKEYFHYDPSTGIVTWIKKSGFKVVVGSRAGSVSPYGHRVIRFKGCLYAEHRLIWLWYTGKHPVKHIDHINHDEQDNRWVNLREVSQAKNNMNNSKRSDNTLGVTGVSISNRNGNKKYCAEITLKGVRRRKHFYTFEDAVSMRKQWEKELGFHINHGIDKP